MNTIRMAWSDLRAKDRDYVNDVLDSGWFSRKTYIPMFERDMAKLHGQKHGMMVNSGTDALRIGLATLKEVHQWRDGDEVIVPAVTFVATVNVVLQNNLKPVFVDVHKETYNMDPEKLEEAISPYAVAIIPVHLFGLPADMQKILPIARKYKLKVLEDSCETLGVHKVKGDMAAFSTYMAHMVQTGVGGVLTTNNPKYDKIARSFMNHGRTDDPDRFEFERIGYSSRVTELEAALGCAQLERLDEIQYRRRMNAAYYLGHLKDLPMQLPVLHWTEKELERGYMLFPMVLKQGSRDKFMLYMKSKGIETRQMMPLINQKPYRSLVKQSLFPVARWINENGVCLPVHQKLLDTDLRYVVKCVKEFFN